MNNYEDKSYPVYETQEGGYARPVKDCYILITDSDCPGIIAGDIVPEEWGLTPINKAARSFEYFIKSFDSEINRW